MTDTTDFVKTDHMEFRSVESTHCIVVDDRTGLPVGLVSSSPTSRHRVGIEASVVVEVDGDERRSPTGGIEYVDTVRLMDCLRTAEPTSHETTSGRTWRVPVRITGAAGHDGLVGALLYNLNRSGPACSLGFDFVGAQTIVVRNLVFRGSVHLDDGAWSITAPGNGIAGATPLEAITSAVGISPIGGLRGSSGLIHIESANNADRAASIWFDNDVEIPEIDVRGTSASSLSFTLTTNFAADLAYTTSNELQLCSFDIDVPRWSHFPALFDGWLRSRGHTSPGASPDWVAGAMMYEAQIGFSVFAQTNHYSPYPEVSDLTNDLDRIQGLGFSVVQLMPRQPYPSYNVHDYWNVDVSYGPRAMLIELIDQCHARGMRIIFDVLLHGVLDQESIGAAADGVRAGPFADLVTAETTDSFGSDVNDWQNYLTAWSRHILDFEPHWRAGSPTVSPLIAEHPEWFARDSAGNVAGVYTKAFDPRNREWQAYFTEAMSFLMTELGIDGFRFDAPTYNEFPNWASWARGRAGSSALSCVGLFERLRPVLKGIKSDSLMYTEPSGHALRRSMDLNYNYDEQWLVTAITNPESVKPWGVKTAKGLARWIRERDALLPNGSLTAHHIDSHDTFWWPTWGKKWRREQFTAEQFRMLTVIFGSLPGPFMMFTGGEQGIDDLLPLLAILKSRREWRGGAVSWWTSDEVPDSVFGLTRSLGEESTTVLVNYSGDPVTISTLGRIPSIGSTQTVLFAVAGDAATVGSTDLVRSDDRIVLAPFSAVAYSEVRS
jgi:glycosidase